MRLRRRHGRQRDDRLRRQGPFVPRPALNVPESQCSALPVGKNGYEPPGSAVRAGLPAGNVEGARPRESAAAAFAAGHVACDGRTDFVRLHLAGGNPWDGSDTACFANAGAVGVDLSGVGRIDSGNNVVTVYWDGGRTDLGRWQGSTRTSCTPARS
ncbi:beta/gamma crystallin domain-containing protein [Amycolatopsis sp. NBC_01480]|uniref:beta/gamma crystallin domain-containing protein n=1 Tax=Amycolatopsis sp. NBC_01480 TaxID=2903562 RepID=UPI003FA46943